MIGISFSGGGARGIAHLGVLKALMEEGIEPAIISGTSAGAIVGSFQAAGISPEEALEVIIKTKLLAIFKPAFSWRGLLSIKKLGKILDQHLPKDFESLKTPLIVAATDIYAGETKYFNAGPITPAIMASSCIPVVFSPVDIDGTLYVDGGLLNNLPAEPIREQSSKVIGISCNPYTYNPDLNNVKSLMERSALLAINGNTAKSKDLCDVVIEPPNLARFSGFDLTNARHIFDEGYNFTRENMSTFASELT